MRFESSKGLNKILVMQDMNLIVVGTMPKLQIFLNGSIT